MTALAVETDRLEKMTPPQLERFLIRERLDRDTFKDAYRPKITAADAWMIRTFGLDARRLGYKAAVIEKCAYPLTAGKAAKK